MRRVQLALELQPLSLRWFDRAPFGRGLQSRRATSRVRTYWLASSVSPWSRPISGAVSKALRQRLAGRGVHAAMPACRHAGMLRKRLHEFKQISHELFVANSELGTLSQRARAFSSESLPRT